MGRSALRRDLRGAAGQALRCLAEVDLVHVGEDGRVLVAYPFSGRLTGHSVRLYHGPTAEAMCAIDALGIPLMTGRDAVVVSTDPDNGRVIRIERRGDDWRWVPADTAVVLAQSTRCGPAADCLCPSITFHTSRRAAAEHLAQRPELVGEVLDQIVVLDIAERAFGSPLADDTPPSSAGDHLRDRPVSA